MSEPQVSVIIPVHNAQPYLKQCLDSILAQTLEDIEIICVNDDSTDGSAELLRAYAAQDKRIEVISVACHCAGKARNIGLKRAKGTYLSFLDSDDFFEPKMLEKATEALNETGADVVVYGSWIYDNDLAKDIEAKWNLRNELLPDANTFSWKDMPGSIFNAFGNYTWNKLFRSSMIFESGIRFQEIARTNDLFFTCCALIEARSITTLEEAYVHYRVNSSTSLQATNDKTPTVFLEAFKELRRYIERKDITKEVNASYLAQIA